MRGGVCFNEFFMERMAVNMNEQIGAGLTPDRKVAVKLAVPAIKTLDDLNMDEESWENAMYALFGYLCIKNTCNFVPSCTGAERAVCGGKIAPGNNMREVVKLMG
jgi:1,6-anhydro-N-acetylmuramate kinase